MSNQKKKEIKDALRFVNLEIKSKEKRINSYENLGLSGVAMSIGTNLGYFKTIQKVLEERL